VRWSDNGAGIWNECPESGIVAAGVQDQSMLQKLIQAAAIVALLTGTASAQIPMSLKNDKPPPTAEEIAKQKVIDQAYKSASQKIPDKQVADPWGDVRQSPAPPPKNKH
jgi:hypothetical protein